MVPMILTLGSTRHTKWVSRQDQWSHLIKSSPNRLAAGVEVLGVVQQAVPLPVRWVPGRSELLAVDSSVVSWALLEEVNCAETPIEIGISRIRVCSIYLNRCQRVLLGVRFALCYHRDYRMRP